ncbi:SDR family NAD(P)-dependent oxidoreductase [Streptomyces cupreus]|uniref:SDR family oxidoreductase n=1 Tax=Streptomyces cupreus TaxID=2759956 RepID=A0A7X1JHK8_9ACTN|nr:SDR family oxidoreductase [Streptomyces cupreus]MBC2908112.1 SDR family oxidoreductase [Streptomyces cupreus]
MADAWSDAPVALVTGSASGIVAAVARRLAAEGMRVVVNRVPGPRAGTRLAAELPDVICFAADIAVREQAEALVAATVERYGRLDVLVNSAGAAPIVPHPDFEAANAKVQREIFDLGVIGTWQLCVAAMPYLRAGGDGCVVNVSPAADLRPAGSSLSCAVNDLTRLLATVTGPGVRVHSVAPGPTDTVAQAVLTTVRSRCTTGEALLTDGATHPR